MVTASTVDLAVERASLGDAAVAEAWTELQHRDGVATPFLSWEWYGALAEIPELAASTEVLMCRRGASTVGLLPIETVERRGLRTLGVAGWYWFTPDHLEVVAAPCDRESVAREIAVHLATRRDWDTVDLDALADHSALGLALKGVMHRPRFVTRADLPVPILIRRLTNDEGPLLSKGVRKQLRRELKLIEDQGGTLEMVTDPNEVVDLIEELISLHRSRFGDRSNVFATAERRRFHLTAARRMSAAGRARVARLRIGGVDVALSFMLIWGSTVCFYSGGLRPDIGRSPGFALRAWAVKQVAEEGFTTVDFLRGDHEWKQRLANRELRDTRVRIVRVTPRVVTTGMRRVLRRYRDVDVD